MVTAARLDTMNPPSQYIRHVRAGERAGSPALAALSCLLSSALISGCLSFAPADHLTGSSVPLVVAAGTPQPSVAASTDSRSARVASAGTLPEQSADQRPDSMAADDEQVGSAEAARTRRLFEQARTLVADFTGASLGHVRLELATDRVIDTVVAAETRHLVDAQFSDAPFRRSLLDSIMHSQQGSYAALYADSRATVMISENLLRSYMESLLAVRAIGPRAADLQDQALLALLVHELVHAADDTQHRIHANRTMTFRASFAQSAVFEGHAQWVTRQICEQHGCSEGLAALDRFMFAISKPANRQAQSVQALSRNVLEYSYVEGERFIRELAEREGGAALIELALKVPPVDPIQILDPLTFPDRAREQRNQQLLAASARLDHPWQQAPWASVETSPLKGVNLRAEPQNRTAAVDGFTRLINAMVAIQLYDQSHSDHPPIEVTLIGTDTDATAALFASIMHENARAGSRHQSRERHALRKDTGQLLNAAVYASYDSGASHDSGANHDSAPGGQSTAGHGRERTAAGQPATGNYASLTATTGRHVVQLAGFTDIAALRDYALKFLTQVERSELVDAQASHGSGLY